MLDYKADWNRGALNEHPDLLSWVADQRANLIWSALILGQAWIAKGRPKYRGKKLGSLEKWSEVLGGILNVAGIDGFLSNLDEFYEDSDAEGAAWRNFITAWWNKWGAAEVTVSNIFDLAEDLPLGDGNERSQKTKLGKLARSVWQTQITEPKSQKSRSAIPIIGRLAHRLEFHRERLGNPVTGPMFPNESGTPMDLNNLLTRTILPVLNRCGICKESKDEHRGADHDYVRDESLPIWRGWHAFRRGLATNLHRLGVPEKTIQAILRHANVSTTQTCYIKTASDEARAAMTKLESVLDSNQPVKSTAFDLDDTIRPVTIQ